MKVAIIVLTFMAIRAVAEPTNDILAISAAVPSATRITATSTGYRIETPSGTRQARATATGYRIEGGHGTEAVQLIRTSTGYRVESSRGRAEAIRTLSKR